MTETLDTRTLDTPGGLVLAGVDGSDSSLIALRWAAADAVRRRAGSGC